MSKIKRGSSEGTERYYEELTRRAERSVIRRRGFRATPEKTNSSRSTFAGTISHIPLRPVYTCNTDHND